MKLGLLFREKLAPLSMPRRVELLYRVNHHLSDLGWVDFDLDVPHILPSYLTQSAKLSSDLLESGT